MPARSRLAGADDVHTGLVQRGSTVTRLTGYAPPWIFSTVDGSAWFRDQNSGRPPTPRQHTPCEDWTVRQIDRITCSTRAVTSPRRPGGLTCASGIDPRGLEGDPVAQSNGQRQGRPAFASQGRSSAPARHSAFFRVSPPNSPRLGVAAGRAKTRDCRPISGGGSRWSRPDHPGEEASAFKPESRSNRTREHKSAARVVGRTRRH